MKRIATRREIGMNLSSSPVAMRTLFAQLHGDWYRRAHVRLAANFRRLPPITL